MDQSLSLTPNDLCAMLGTECPMLIDICVPEDVAADPWRLSGAEHVAHGEIADWLTSHRPRRHCIVICQKSLKLSHGAAAQLRSAGLDARVLEGGNLAWRNGGFPRLSLATAPSIGTLWVLPVPASAWALCAVWLIKRWFDPRAQLLWVPKDLVEDVAARFEAVPVETNKSLSAICGNAGLGDPRLSRFVSGIDANAGEWLDLLGALPQLHPTVEAQAAAALPLVDLAWTAATNAGASDAA